tara:strand:- start:5164 stop:6453 length:1290 start_codon:yes stop_codon:yes gene_type:complete
MINNNIFLSLIKKSFNVFILRILSIFLGFIFTYYITQLYGAEGMGVFALCQSILMISTLFSLVGTDIASVKFISTNFYQKKYSKIKSIYLSILKIVIPISAIISLMAFLSIDIASDIIFNKPSIRIGLFYIIIAILPLCLIYIHSESLRGMKKVELYSIIKYFLTPFFSIILLAIFYDSSNIFLPILVYCTSIILASIIGFIIWIKKSRFFITDSICTSISEVLKISLPLMVSSSMLLLLQWIDILILGYFETSSQIGVYNVAVKISMFASIILFSINSIVAPKISEFFNQKKFFELKKIIKASSKLMFFSTIPILILILVFSEFILSFFGEEFASGIFCLNILIVGQLINVLCGSVGYILNMTEHQNVFKWIIILSFILNIVLNIILIPLHGIFGAAISSMISLILWNILSCIYIYKKFNISTIWFIK